MIVIGVSKPLLLRIAQQIGVKIEYYREEVANGHQYAKFVLKPVTTIYSRERSDGSLMNSVCFHGHRKFIEKVFEVNQAAYVSTSVFGRLEYSSRKQFDMTKSGGNERRNAFWELIYIEQECTCHKDKEIPERIPG